MLQERKEDVLKQRLNDERNVCRTESHEAGVPFSGPPLPVTSPGPGVCSLMQKWMHSILAYSYKVREWRAGVYTRESGPESVQFLQSLSAVLLP